MCGTAHLHAFDAQFQGALREKPRFSQTTREMGHPLCLDLDRTGLDKNFAGQCSQGAGCQGVLDEAPGLGCAGGIYLHTFDPQFKRAFDVAEFHDFDAGGQSRGAPG